MSEQKPTRATRTEQIRAELMAMRAEGAENKALIRAACAKLFAIGVVPNQSNVLQLVRVEGSSPSAQTIQGVINAFLKPIFDRYGEPSPIQAEGVPEPIRNVLGEVAPRLAEVAEALGRSWYRGEVARLEASTQTAMDAAAGFERAAADMQALLDAANVELAHTQNRVRELGEEKALAIEEGRRLSERLAEAQAQARADAVRIEQLELAAKSARTEAAEATDAHRRAAKDLASARESVAALRAQIDDAASARERDERAHENAINALKTSNAQAVARLEYDLSQANTALKGSRAEKRTLTLKVGELGGVVKALTEQAERLTSDVAQLTAALRTAQDELVVERARRANSYADAGRVVEWIRTGVARKLAVHAFTEGPERQIAYAVEDALAGIGALRPEGGKP